MTRWFERLLDHIEWADERVLDAVRDSGDPGALELVAHVLATERVWLRRLRSGGSPDVEVWPELSADACERRMDENLRAYRRVLSGCSPEDLERPVEYENSAGTRYRTPLGEILLHVALHGAYHRGQIAREIRATGGEPVNTDFITFVREHPRPSARG